MPPARRSARTASSTAARDSAQPYTRANRQSSTSPGPRPSASVARAKTGLRLTVKAPPSKLRQATSGTTTTIPPNPYAQDGASESDATPAPVSVRMARSTRNPRTVVEPESDEDEEDEGERGLEDGDEGDEDGQGEDLEDDAEGEDVDQELLANEDSEEDIDAEGSEEEEEDEDEDEDEDMEDVEQDGEEDEHPPPPIITHEILTNNNLKTTPNVTVTAPPEGTLKSVEAKEMEDLDSNSNDEEDEDEEEELSELDSDEESSSNDNDDIDTSRAATPDLSKLTRRQRGLYDEAAHSSLMALSNEAQKKKHLTAEEHAMRRAEMARRRKNLSEKRNEEEKMDTINKLLKKPAPKRRTRAEILAAQQQADSMGTPGVDGEGGEEERADPLFVRWVQGREGSRLGVPVEWVEGGGVLGEMFGRGFMDAVGGGGVGVSGGGRMVEEVA